jgi:hypothetical protein
MCLVLAILCLYVLPMHRHFWLFLSIVDSIYCRVRDTSGLSFEEVVDDV